MFSALLLRTRITQPGWIIAGVKGDGSHHILMIIEPPITEEMARKIALRVANNLKIEKIIDQTRK